MAITGAPIIVMLLGESKTDWRKEVIDRFPGIPFFNPAANTFDDKQHEFVWKLAAILRCEVVFAYMGKDNPPGAEFMFLLGYAYAIGKTVLLVNDSFIVNTGQIPSTMAANYNNMTDALYGLELFLANFSPKEFDQSMFGGLAKAIK